MSLLLPGYWQREYWPQCYWIDAYWQNPGVSEGGETLVIRSKVNLTISGKSKVKLTINNRSTI